MNIILVADDDELALKGMVRFLSNAFTAPDWKIVTAGSIAEAVEKIREHDVTHIVHDMGFVAEKGNGTSFYNAIRPMLLERQLVVHAVAVTGGTSHEDRAFMTSHSIRVFDKPITTELRAFVGNIKNGEPNIP